MDERRRDSLDADARLEEIVREVKASNHVPSVVPPAQPAPVGAGENNRPSYAQRSNEPQPERKGKGKIIAAVSAGVIGVMTMALFGYTYLYGAIHRGVCAGTVPIGGMTIQQAERAIDEAGKELLGGASIKLSIHNQTYNVDIGSVTDGMDSRATAEQAYAYARQGNPFARVGQVLGSLFGGHEIALAVKVNDEALAQRLDEISNEALTPPVDPTWSVEDDTLHIDTGKEGVDFDRAQVGEIVAEKIRVMDFEPYQVEIESEKQKAVDLSAIQADIEAEPKNAVVDKSDGKTIVPSVDGIKLDLAKAEEIVGDGSQPSYDVPITRTPADISAKKLSEVLFRDTLASTSTKLNAGNRMRTNNVRLACEHINGTILNPGEEFSYNGVVGERTAARGFQSAGAYSNGKVVDEVGGGVCQPSSTLYMAVLRADLEVTKRSNHSFTVSYTPLGEDATVSWGGPDFCFKNNTPYPIKIVSSQSGSLCNMAIVGTKTSDKKVTLSTEVLSTIPFETVEKTDKTLAAGAKRTEQTGSTGYKTVTYKTITENGKTTTVKANNSSYKKRDKIVLVGPAAPAVPTPPATPETPAPAPETEAPADTQPAA